MNGQKSTKSIALEPPRHDARMRRTHSDSQIWTSANHLPETVIRIHPEAKVEIKTWSNARFRPSKLLGSIMMLVLFGTIYQIYCIREVTQFTPAVSNFDEEKIALYRIIGNDLPPRHKPGQSITNLIFTLENEPTFDQVEKWYVLNRIVDQEKEKTIISLLERFNQRYIRIPFNKTEYRRVDFVLDSFPLPDYIHHPKFLQNASRIMRMYAMDQIYHDKNRYVMNNNGGRNVALYAGQARARWTMVFDGNCFVTKTGMEAMRKVLDTTGKTEKYFIVPMARVLNNNLLLDPSYNPDAVEEPQIIFRYDAKESFNENMRYGRRPKLDLLWRLGYERGLSTRRILPWELKQSLIERSNDIGSLQSAGWVARLFSGSVRQELPNSEGAKSRNMHRLSAIHQWIGRLDESLLREAGLNARRWAFWNEDEMRTFQLAYWSHTAPSHVNNWVREGHSVMENATSSQDFVSITLAWLFIAEHRMSITASLLLERLTVEMENKMALIQSDDIDMDTLSWFESHPWPMFLDSVRILQQNNILNRLLMERVRMVAVQLLNVLLRNRVTYLRQTSIDDALQHDIRILVLAAFTDELLVGWRTLHLTRSRLQVNRDSSYWNQVRVIAKQAYGFDLKF